VNILSLQSWVAYGHVGNAAAMFPLQRLGAEVWAIHTVQFSNHPGYGDFRGEAYGAERIGALVDGVASRGALAHCDAVLSGYVGEPGVGDAILGAVARARAANPCTLYACDPVIGDVGRGEYVRPGIADFFRERAVPEADLLMPNQFELAALTGMACDTLQQAAAAAARLRLRMRSGPAVIFVTSLQLDGGLDLLVAAEACHRIRLPRLPRDFNGAGDAIAALLLLHFLRTGDAVAAAEMAASSIHGILRHTHAEGSRELLLVQAQGELVAPSLLLRAEPVSV
jgi:pyridoxine kinase